MCGFGVVIVECFYVVGYCVVLVDIVVDVVYVYVCEFDLSGVCVIVLLFDVMFKCDFEVVCDVFVVCWGMVDVFVNNVGVLKVVLVMEIIVE